jgi:hypothetical protein
MYEIFAIIFGTLCTLAILAALAMPFVILGFFIIAHIDFQRGIRGK